MKLISYTHNNQESCGILSPDEQSVYPLSSLGLNCHSLKQLIESPTLQNQLQHLEIIETAVKIPITEIQYAPPIKHPSKDLICLGLNYAKHVEESSRFKKEDFGKRENAVYFSKRVNACVAHNATISAHADITGQLDYEAELAIIIGKGGRYISAEEAYDHVFGYTIMNDVSARELQTGHKQWYLGKSLDDFCPMGPVIVTKDAFTYPLELNIYSRINGELRQQGNTRDLIFNIPYVIHELSQGITLGPGDIILTGTPAGVGMGFTPPKWLKHGDVIECEIEGIGCLRNIID